MGTKDSCWLSVGFDRIRSGANVYGFDTIEGGSLALGAGRVRDGYCIHPGNRGSQDPVPPENWAGPMAG